MESKVTFNQKWIEDAVRGLLNKKTGDILKSDIEKIKYLRIGEGEDNSFIIEMGLQSPSMPFVDTDGGDEWNSACIEGKDIAKFLKENKDDEDIQLSLFDFEYKENKKYTKYALSEEASEKWEEYRDSIVSSEYYEEIEDEEEWEKWYDKTCESIQFDIPLFSGVEVLRLNGMTFENFKCFESLNKLSVLEVVGTCFSSSEYIDSLKHLKQLCAWLD